MSHLLTYLQTEHLLFKLFISPHNIVVAREVRGRQQSCLVVIRSLYLAILAFLLISGDIPLGHCSERVL